MSNANRAPARVRDFHRISRLRIASISYIARKNPGMPARNAVGGFSIHANSGQASNSRMKSEKGADFYVHPQNLPTLISWY